MADRGSIDTVGIVGAGAMGAGIAQVAATGGMTVRLHDIDPAAIDRALSEVSARIDRLAEKGRLSAEAATAARARLHPAPTLADLAPSGLVVEAVVEKLELKQTLFAELETHVGPETILASNTSSLPIGAIARACRRPERVAGMHFFNPVPLMRLVEIIPAARTAPSVVAALTEAARRMGREPVTVTDSPGFLVNLGGRPYLQEALHILQEGVAPVPVIDRAMRACGFRLGPFELMDLTGLDVNWPASRVIHDGFMADPRLRTTPRHRLMAESGLLGRKTGQGHYRYGADGRPVAEPVAEPAEAPTPAATAVSLAEPDPALQALVEGAGLHLLPDDDGTAPILVAPLGEDATAAALRLGLPPARLVAVDMTGPTDRHLTLMQAPGSGRQAAQALAAALATPEREVAVIGDSCGFIGQRMLAMIANLGCEMAQTGLAAPADIDRAMTLGLNYPQGPLALCAALGPRRVLTILETLQRLTGDDRYRPSLWLRRRATLELPIHTPD